MQKRSMKEVEEFLRRAAEFKAEAKKAAGQEREHFLHLADEWERLAKYRLSVIKMYEDIAKRRRK